MVATSERVKKLKETILPNVKCKYMQMIIQEEFNEIIHDTRKLEHERLGNREAVSKGEGNRPNP